MDDVAIITDADGWVLIQAKKGMRLEQAHGSPFAEALSQLVDLDAEGVPDGSADPDRSRPLDPARDRVFILTDESAPLTVTQNLTPVVDRLRDLKPGVPVAEVHKNEGQKRAFDLLKGHLARLWAARHGSEMQEADLRRLGKLLGITVVKLADGGNHVSAVFEILKGIAPDASVRRQIWGALERHGVRLAEERSFVDRKDLVVLLEAEGIVLLPVARLRPDINALRERSSRNLAALARTLTIAGPEGSVALERTVLPTILAADGNLAIIGDPGVGKTVVLHKVATQHESRGMDVVLLRASDLGATGGQTRAELNLVHDLDDALAGWSGSEPGLLLIDGLDQARGADPSNWLADLAEALTTTRWRMVATIRTYDLRHGRNWRRMFAGDALLSQSATAALSGVRHVVVEDLSASELAPLFAASPRLSQLFSSADPRLQRLLMNPFSLDLASRLLTHAADTDFTAVRSQVDLLHAYWEQRVHADMVGRLDRIRTLQGLVEGMVEQGRQALSAAELPPSVVSTALESLSHNGVLRDMDTAPGHAGPPVEFTHPVLFDYAAALFALGDPSRAGSLGDRLDQAPNLAITLRPSLYFRLATVWRGDKSRAAYWRLALRVASLKSGHPLAAAAAARVAAVEVEEPSGYEPLGRACTGSMTDPDLASADGPAVWYTETGSELGKRAG